MGETNIQINDYFHTIQAICENHNIHWLPRHGFMQIAENDFLWCPNSTTRQWNNTLSADATRIDEIRLDNAINQNQYINEMITARQRRITWHRGTLAPLNDYVFVGVFVIDADASRQAGHCVWTRIADAC